MTFKAIFLGWLVGTIVGGALSALLVVATDDYGHNNSVNIAISALIGFAVTMLAIRWFVHRDIARDVARRAAQRAAR